MALERYYELEISPRANDSMSFSIVSSRRNSIEIILCACERCDIIVDTVYYWFKNSQGSVYISSIRNIDTRRIRFEIILKNYKNSYLRPKYCSPKLVVSSKLMELPYLLKKKFM